MIVLLLLLALVLGRYPISLEDVGRSLLSPVWPDTAVGVEATARQLVLRVREMALMGRAPHLSLFGSPSAADRAIADEALENVGLQDLRERPYTEISGGERQLTLIARGLAQKCDVLLMDEPTAHLDLSNQHRVLEMVDHLARQGLSFIISSHAPNQALSYASRVLLLHKGRVLAYGSPQETLTETLLSTAYGMRTEVIYERRNGRDEARAVVAQGPHTLPAAALDWPHAQVITPQI